MQFCHQGKAIQDRTSSSRPLQCKTHQTQTKCMVLCSQESSTSVLLESLSPLIWNPLHSSGSCSRAIIPTLTRPHPETKSDSLVQSWFSMKHLRTSKQKKKVVFLCLIYVQLFFTFLSTLNKNCFRSQNGREKTSGNRESSKTNKQKPGFSTSLRQDARKATSPSSSQLVLPSVSWK